MNAGTRFTGKWSGLVVEVVSLLGAGANGKVYLVKTPLGKAAMKVCPTSSDAALEWSVLTSVHQSGATAFPKPMVIDDGPPSAPFFYVMEWIPGEPLTRVLEAKDWPRGHQATLLILEALVELHRAGYAFCDLKPDNILVVENHGTLKVRFVDVGGVTPFGRSVRQFTPQCDRAYFDYGTRKAEASYDLCALVLGLVLAFTDTTMSEIAKWPPAKRRQWLDRQVAAFPVVEAREIFAGVLGRRLLSSAEVLRCWSKVDGSEAAIQVRRRGMMGRMPRTSKQTRQTAGSTGRLAKHAGGTWVTSGLAMHAAGAGGASSLAKHRAGARAQRKRSDWTEWVMWLSILSAAAVTLVAWVNFLS